MAFDDEIWRLADIWHSALKRLYQESLSGRCSLTEEEQWKLVCEMPESKEHTRLANLQAPSFAKMDELVKQMWATPARTAEGRRAKVLGLLGCIVNDDWRTDDESADYDIRGPRDLLLEFVGLPASHDLSPVFHLP